MAISDSDEVIAKSAAVGVGRIRITSAYVAEVLRLELEREDRESVKLAILNVIANFRYDDTALVRTLGGLLGPQKSDFLVASTLDLLDTLGASAIDINQNQIRLVIDSNRSPQTKAHALQILDRLH